MKNIQNHYKTIDEWRNCPMANFICTVVIETGLETNTPRGKMFMLSLLNNGSMDLDENVVKRLYECCLCGLCTQCGFDDTDIPATVAAARADIYEAGMIPEEISKLAQQIKKDCIWERYEDAEKMIPASQEVVAFLTWDDENAKSFDNLAKKAGITALVINESKLDSALLYEIGFLEDSKKYTDRIIKLAGSKNISSVVIDSPHLWNVLKNSGSTEKFLTTPDFVKQLIDSGKITLKKKSIDSLTYHDPCKLVRNADHDAVRDILGVAGIELMEMRWNRKDAKCCGGPVLKKIAPQVSTAIAKRRISQIDQTGAKKIMVTCGHCLENFKENGLSIDTVKFLDFIVSLCD